MARKKIEVKYEDLNPTQQSAAELSIGHARDLANSAIAHVSEVVVTRVVSGWDSFKPSVRDAYAKALSKLMEARSLLEYVEENPDAS